MADAPGPGLCRSGRSAGRRLSPRWLAPLLPYSSIYAVLDADGAGALNAARLTALSPRIASARIPAGNDVTEFAQQGGDVRMWVMKVARLTQKQKEREKDGAVLQETN